jgi:hypothetical protein
MFSQCYGPNWVSSAAGARNRNLLSCVFCMPNPHPQFPLSTSIDNAAYWLARAEEVQVIAEGMIHHETRLKLLELAEAYRGLAENAYRRSMRQRV